MNIRSYKEMLSPAKSRMLGIAPLVYFVLLEVMVVFYSIQLNLLGSEDSSFFGFLTIQVAIVALLAYVLRFRLDYGVYFIFAMLKQEQFYLEKGYIGMLIIIFVLYFLSLNGMVMLIILSMLNYFLNKEKPEN